MLSEKTAKEAKPTDKPQKLPHEKVLYLNPMIAALVSVLFPEEGE